MVSEVAPHIANVLMISSTYVLVALGFALIFSVMRIMNFAHGAIYMVGGYVCYYFWVVLGFNPWVSLMLDTLVIGLFGLLLEKFLFRPFQLDFEKAVIMAIALAMILQTGADLTVGPDSGLGMPSLLQISIGVWNVRFRGDRLIVLAICIILWGALTLFINKSKVGWSMLAIAHDRDAAALQGINTNRISGLACAIACGLAGLTGGLVSSVLALYVGMADVILVKIMGVIILAGIGSISGIWVGGLVLGALDAICPIFTSSAIADSLGLGVIILILIIRPKGFFGQEV